MTWTNQLRSDSLPLMSENPGVRYPNPPLR